MSRKSTKGVRKGMSGTAKWIITMSLFAIAVLTVFLCWRSGSFNFKPGYVQANDEAAQESNVPVESGSDEEETVKHKVFISSGKGGSTDPEGCVYVDDWGSLTIAINADEGYEVKSVTVDGSEAGAVSSYTLSYIKEDHVVIVKYEKIEPTPSFDPNDPFEYFGDE